MVYSFFTKMISGYLAGTEILPVDNGGGLQVGATTGQIANAPGPFGSGTGTFGRSGNLFAQASSAGITPAGTGSDYVVAVATIPANSFDIANRSIEIGVAGSFGANGNNQRIKLIVGATAPVVGAVVSGGTTIADSGTVTTNGGGWSLQSEITKTGAAGSNTQLALHEYGTGGAALTAPTALTLAENAAINVVVTINAGTTAADAVFNFLQGFAQN